MKCRGAALPLPGEGASSAAHLKQMGACGLRVCAPQDAGPGLVLLAGSRRDAPPWGVAALVSVAALPLRRVVVTFT